MKKILLFIYIVIFTHSCVTVSKFNSEIDKLRTEDQLKSDVDFAYKKLQNLHPVLYQFISKDDLESKIDSLKSEITSPMTSNDFYFKFNPIITSIGQGHTQLSPIQKKETGKEKRLSNQKTALPLTLFEYEILDDKLYVFRNFTPDSTIQRGTEILKINETKPSEIINKYKDMMPYDGFNRKFQESATARRFPILYYYENEKIDSAIFKFSYNDSIFEKNIKRELIENQRNEKNLIHKKPDKLLEKKRVTQGYNKNTKLYARELEFLEKDSSIALMTLRNFTDGNFRKFYKQSFSTIAAAGTKDLIIDLRNNTGGSVEDAQQLFGYLVSENFIFIEKPEMTSPLTPSKALIYEVKNTTTIQKLILPFAIPSFIIVTGYYLLGSKKSTSNYYLLPRYGKEVKPKTDNFKGNIYLITNSMTFSAASILASNLQGANRAKVVGKETGGADKGCVAGFMPKITLPNSKLTLRIGTLNIKPHFSSGIHGRGVMPDMTVIPTLSNRINGEDVELQAILDEIKKGKINQ